MPSGLPRTMTSPGARAGVALHMPRIDDADRNETVDRLDGVDRVAAGDRNAGARANRLAAVEDAPDRVERQRGDRHADDGQREERRRAHRVDVRDARSWRRSRRSRTDRRRSA